MTVPARRTTFENVACRIPYDHFVVLSVIAEADGKTLSDVLRRAVAIYVQLEGQDLVRRGALDDFGKRPKGSRKRR